MYPSRLQTKMRTLLSVFFILGLSGAAFGQQVEVYVTSKAGDRIRPHPSVNFAPGSTNAGQGFRIDSSTSFQKIDGFGASMLEAGPICLESLDAAAREGVYRALFDPKDGAGFSAMKTVIGATDFMSAGPYYTYDDVPGDLSLLHFSIARDLKPLGLIPYIKHARQYGSFVLQAPMDYPPDWMLFDLKNHQDVDPHFFPVLAHYYVHYLQEYEKQGIFIDYLSPFNEPSIYTKISAEKIRDLIRDDVGPLFAREGIEAKIQICDFPNRETASKYLPIILGDPEARKYIGGISYHGYEFKDFDNIAAIHQQYPRLPIWMTEVDHSYGTDTPRTKPLPRYDYEDGDFWGNQIISDLESGTSAWIYWNMILDEQGGPYLLSEAHRDGPNNFQHPVVIINRHTKRVFYTALYYYLAHFSKFVRPGAYRIGVNGKVAGVRCIAFRNKNGTLTAEVLNSQAKSVETTLLWQGKTLQASLPALSLSTFLWKPEIKGEGNPLPRPNSQPPSR